VNVEVSMAVARVRVACGRIQELRGDVAAKLNDFDLTLWDKLETYAFALLQANTTWSIAQRTLADLDDLTQQARAQFELLYAVVQVLVSRGLANSASLRISKQHRGRLRYAYGLTESELTQAELIGEQLARGVALQNSPIEQLKHLTELRDRAFTVLVRAYGQVRHAIQYLRRDQHDAHRYVPSLYGRRRSRKVKAQVSAVTPEISAQPASAAQSADASLPAERVPQQHQKTSFDADSPLAHASETAEPGDVTALLVPAPGASAPQQASSREAQQAAGSESIAGTMATVRARPKARRAKRAGRRRRLGRKAQSSAGLP
jgi:hypothetical protein